MPITENLLRIEEKIQSACVRSRRNREEIRLMGVSKFHSREAVEEAWKAGLRLFGENRVQEGLEKFTGFREGHAGTELHLIGSLQRNKVKIAAPFFDCIQSVDRDSVIHELGKTSGDRGTALELLLELHTGEESKSGFPGEESLFRAVETALAYPGLRIRGLMTMAPYTGSEGPIRNAFRRLVKVRDALEARFPPDTDKRCRWTCLSMGMSGDFEIAIEEGSTLLRIGTGIFGERRQ
ncbi:MAG: YggS family pyridoxal phosphate-dependent enzyme [Treponema sp.]|jgi:pyridoxal phosphate enzyme (YggS family)|nr:YggS family pyridoxal phosphate-dependent enzyme [Treponema sp.]